jgi:hypothetical protein
MKYRDNMSVKELAKFKKELQALEDAYSSASEHDAKMQEQNPLPEEWENQSDYVGMGWIDSRGRP